jgi:uncharacterized protein YktA (UPF0223 family)
LLITPGFAVINFLNDFESAYQERGEGFTGRVFLSFADIKKALPIKSEELTISLC